MNDSNPFVSPFNLDVGCLGSSLSIESFMLTEVNVVHLVPYEYRSVHHLDTSHGLLSITDFLVHTVSHNKRMHTYIHIFLIDHQRKIVLQLYVREKQMVHRNSLLLRLRMALFGCAKLCELDNLEFYVFRCPVHGIMTDYARGHGRYLDCSYCRYE